MARVQRCTTIGGISCLKANLLKALWAKATGVSSIPRMSKYGRVACRQVRSTAIIAAFGASLAIWSLSSIWKMGFRMGMGRNLGPPESCCSVGSSLGGIKLESHPGFIMWAVVSWNSRSWSWINTKRSSWKSRTMLLEFSPRSPTKFNLPVPRNLYANLNCR